MTFPMTSSPIPNGMNANAPRWWSRFFKPVSDAIADLQADETGWTGATLAGLWVNFGGGFAFAGYRRRRGVVWLRGTVKSGALGTVFTLPAGYRPSGTALHHVAAAAGAAPGMARVDVAASGVVSVVGYFYAGTNAFVALDGINFVAEN